MEEKDKSCNALALTLAVGLGAFCTGCVVDAVFVWIAVLSGQMLVSSVTYILLMGIPAFCSAFTLLVFFVLQAVGLFFR